MYRVKSAKMMHFTVTGKKSQGKQSKKCIEDLKEGTNRSNIHFEKAVTFAHDRNKWRRPVAASTSLLR